MSRRPPSGTASVEACVVGILLLLVLLAGPLNVPRALAQALDRLMERAVAAVGTDLP